MEAKIKAIHFDITDKLTSFINKKIDKISRRFEAVTEAEVTLKVIKPETAMNKEASVKLMVPPCSRPLCIKDSRHIRRSHRPMP